MTKYRLKDAALQKKLDEISGGDFSRQLNEESLDGCSPDFTFRVRLGWQVGTCFRYSAVFRVDEIMIQEGYDTNAWNKFPEVTPPENTWMRVIQCTHGWTRFTSAFYRDGKWYQELEIDGQLFRKPILGVWKFRPWE